MPKVMIVDDDRVTATLLQTLLSLDGFDVVHVNRAADAMSRANEEHPDIFLIDFRLSDAHGTEIVAALRASSTFQRTPIVMTSGMNVEQDALKVGANAFLIKPFDPGELPTLFHKLIDPS